MRHIHGYQHTGNLLVCHKARAHPEISEHVEEAVPHNCGLCGDICWMSRRGYMFHGMHPTVPTVCCECAAIGHALLKLAIPGTEILTEEVPDLAATGMFN